MRVFPFLLIFSVLSASTAGGSSAAVAAADPPADPAALHISRAATCRGVADREPVDEGTQFQISDERVYLWCEVMNGEGTTITHVYSLNGEPVSSVELAVRTKRFRTWSYKTLRPGSAGKWRVEILAEDDTVLHTAEFRVSGGDG